MKSPPVLKSSDNPLYVLLKGSDSPVSNILDEHIPALIAGMALGACAQLSFVQLYPAVADTELLTLRILKDKRTRFL